MTPAEHSELMREKIRADMDADVTFQCNDCEESFTSFQGAREHWMNAHSWDEADRHITEW